ncbi:MAG: PorT family protein [Saprospiraceae bacterium]|nr:PorT family protein [Saprospiraceae bacterium]MBP9210623.1 PorT family protein [Saprospiraceae bacterium]
MRSWIFACLMAAGCLPGLQSQDNSFLAGAHLGIQNTWIVSGTDADEGPLLDFETTFRPAFGIDLAYRYRPSWRLLTGLRYALQGQRYSTANVPNALYKTELSYFKLPLLVEYTTRNERPLHIFFQGGIQLAFLASAKSSREDVFEYYSAVLKEVNSYYSNTVVEGVLGCGIEYATGPHLLRLMVRAEYALNDIEQTEKKPALRSVASNAAIALPMVAYLYDF